MKNFKSKIIEIKKNINDFFKINPHLHWVFILKLFFFISFLLILFSVYLLYQIKSDKIFKVEIKPKEGKSILNDKELKSIMENFDKKAKTTEGIMNEPLPYKDPSI